MKTKTVFYLSLIFFSMQACTNKLEEIEIANENNIIHKPQKVIGTSSSWENYIGHTGWNVRSNSWLWKRIVRHSKLDPVNSTADFNTLKTILASYHFMCGSNFTMPGANEIENDPNYLSNFMNSIVSDNGLQHYNTVKSQAQSLVLARQLSGAVGTKIYWQLGNEINNGIIRNAFKSWVESKGLPYPHPNSLGTGGSGGGTGVDDVITSSDPGYIGYMLEYCVAPAIKAINDVNATLPDNDKIIIISGSLANSRNSDCRDWMTTLVNYQFLGTIVPSLANRHMYGLIDGVSHHYLFGEYRTTPDSSNNGLTRHEVLKNMFDLWTDPLKKNNKIKYIYTTEEIGNRCSTTGRAAYHAPIVALSYVDFFQKYSFSADQGRCIFYAVEQTTTGPNQNFVSGLTGINCLDSLIRGRNLSRVPDMYLVNNNTTLEKYAFTTDQNEILLAVHTPSPSSVTAPLPQSFSKIQITLPGTDNYKIAPDGAYLLTIDEFVKPSITTFTNGRIMDIIVKSSPTRTNNSIVVNSNSVVTKFNGTLIIKLIKR